MSTYVPHPEWIVLEWHHACIEAGALCILRCTECSAWRHPPRRFCPQCFSDGAEFQPVSGRGRIITVSVSHRSRDPGWQERAPYATLVIELEEGQRVIAATKSEPDDIVLGAPVHVTIEPRADDFVLVWAEIDPAGQQPAGHQEEEGVRAEQS